MSRLLASILVMISLTVSAQPQVDFVTPSIVRVRWSPNGELTGNGTGVCTWQPQRVKVTSKETATGRSYSSEALTVEVNSQSGAVTFRDRATGRVLLQEDAQRPHEAEPVVTERIVYDEKSARIEDTANGKVTVKDIVRRYTLVPYIYSMAAQQSRQGYTMARMLAFDFADDVAVRDLKDEYMFGRFLVCPVTYPMSEKTTRRIYLPTPLSHRRGAGGEAWIDYWTGKLYDGGQWIEQAVSIDRLPLFVRAGSIIPTTEVAQWTDAQVSKPVTLHIYPGADAHFDLYEDEGDNYDFEQGACSTIAIDWDETKQRLTIGRREGSFPGMQVQRTFLVEMNGQQKQVTYKGKQISVTMKGGRK